MKKVILTILSVLFVLRLSGCAVAGPQTFTWDLSVDDAHLGPTGGYRLYTGDSAANATAVATVLPGVNTITVNINPGKNRVAMLTAFTSDGLESDKTEPLTFDAKPGSPLKFLKRP